MSRNEHFENGARSGGFNHPDETCANCGGYAPRQSGYGTPVCEECKESEDWDD